MEVDPPKGQVYRLKIPWPEGRFNSWQYSVGLNWQRYKIDHSQNLDKGNVNTVQRTWNRGLRLDFGRKISFGQSFFSEIGSWVSIWRRKTKPHHHFEEFHVENFKSKMIVHSAIALVSLSYNFYWKGINWSPYLGAGYRYGFANTNLKYTLRKRVDSKGSDGDQGGYKIFRRDTITASLPRALGFVSTAPKNKLFSNIGGIYSLTTTSSAELGEGSVHPSNSEIDQPARVSSQGIKAPDAARGKCT